MDDDHDGMGVAGEDNGTAAAAKPVGQRRPGPKPAVKPRKTAARSRKPAQAPAEGKPAQGAPSDKAATDMAASDKAATEAAGPEVASSEAELTDSQAKGAKGTPEPGQPTAPADGQTPADSTPATDTKAAPAAGTAAAPTGKPPQPAPTGKGVAAEAASPDAELTGSQAKGAKGTPEPGQPTAPADAQTTADSTPATDTKAAPAAGTAAAQAGEPEQPADAQAAAPGAQSQPAVKARKTAAAAGAKGTRAKAAVPAQKTARAKPAVPAQRRAAAAAAGTKATRAKPAGPAKKAAAAKKPEAVAASEVTEPQKPDAGAPADRSAAPEAAAWQVPGYLHEQDLGAGATGRVVRARHEDTGTLVAIKYLSAAPADDPAFREAFPGEAELLGGLDSPYVARLHAYVEDGPHAAIVRELVDGVGLNALLRANGATDPEAALAVLKGSLLGLAAAHAADVVHRDYRPANVLVTTEGAVKLVDFGVAVRGAESGAPVGVPSYTAPEQWAGGPVTAASDVYAAAATFYECLTGTTPYAGTTVAEFTAQHAQAPIPVDRVPEPVRPLIAKGLADEPAERPQGAADFAAELEALAAAAYGEDWEKRGQDQLATLVGLLTLPAAEDTTAAAPQVPQALPAVVPVAAALSGAGGAGSGPAGFPAGQEPEGGAGDRTPRFGRRAKILAVAAACVIVLGALAVTAVATGNNKDDTNATASPGATVASSPASAPAAVGGTPSAGATTASPTADPSASQPATTPATTATSAGRPATSPTAAPTTPSARPTKTTRPAAGPQVSSVAVTGFTCSAGSHTATATVQVKYDGSAAGTLHLTWWRSASGKPQGAVTMTPQTAKFPKGATGYSFTDKFTFKADQGHPYIGLTVSTDPAAAAGNGSYGVGCH